MKQKQGRTATSSKRITGASFFDKLAEFVVEILPEPSILARYPPQVFPMDTIEVATPESDSDSGKDSSLVSISFNTARVDGAMLIESMRYADEHLSIWMSNLVAMHINYNMPGEKPMTIEYESGKAVHSIRNPNPELLGRLLDELKTVLLMLASNAGGRVTRNDLSSLLVAQSARPIIVTAVSESRIVNSRMIMYKIQKSVPDYGYVFAYLTGDTCSLKPPTYFPEPALTVDWASKSGFYNDMIIYGYDRRELLRKYLESGGELIISVPKKVLSRKPGSDSVVFTVPPANSNDKPIFAVVPEPSMLITRYSLGEILTMLTGHGDVKNLIEHVVSRGRTIVFKDNEYELREDVYNLRTMNMTGNNTRVRFTIFVLSTGRMSSDEVAEVLDTEIVKQLSNVLARTEANNFSVEMVMDDNLDVYHLRIIGDGKGINYGIKLIDHVPVREYWKPTAIKVIKTDHNELTGLRTRKIITHNAIPLISVIDAIIENINQME